MILREVVFLWEKEGHRDSPMGRKEFHEDGGRNKKERINKYYEGDLLDRTG